jgi:hypothetical protein
MPNQNGNAKFSEPAGGGYLWVKQGKGTKTREGQKYLSGFLEFDKDTVPIRVNVLVFRMQDPDLTRNEPSFRIKVLDWEFAPARRTHHGGEPPEPLRKP